MNGKQILSILAICVMFSSVITWRFTLSLATVPSLGPYYLDIPFGEASYYVGALANGSYYAVNGYTWECEKISTSAISCINHTITNLDLEGTIYLKGYIQTDEPIVLSNITLGNNPRFRFLFDRLRVTANCSAFILSDLTKSWRMEGFRLENQVKNSTYPLIKTENKISNGYMDIHWLIGDWYYGRSNCLEIEISDGKSFYDNEIHFHRPYAFKTVLYLHTTGSGWASINEFNLGYFESQSPRQIHILNNGTQGIHNNIITGTGGSCGGWNPQSLSPTWAIWLQTANTGRIVDTAFNDFNIYSASDEIYRAGSLVYGTRFVGGMPRRDKSSWYHDEGSNTEFISIWDPVDFELNTYLSGELWYEGSNITDNLAYPSNSGTSEASNDDWIPHGLAGEPTVVTLTVEETDSRYIIQLKATNSTHFQIYLWDDVAGAEETTDKTINWYVRYDP